jgi:hypothetical protein
MKEVIRFETIDGKEFTDAKDAKAHEIRIAFEDWYEDNKLYGNFEGSGIQFDVLVEWLTKHRTEVCTLLGL